MKKAIVVEFRIVKEGNLVHFSNLTADEKEMLDFIAYKAKGFLNQIHCRVHGSRHYRMQISVVDKDINILVNACCSEYAKDLKKLEWQKIADSFSAVFPGIGGNMFE